MRKIKSLTLSLLLLALPARLAPPAHAQQQAVDDDEVVRISSDLVVLDALVLNKKTGQPMGGLGPADFELYEDGVRQQITYFGQSELPLSVMLLLDVSGSVRPILQTVGEGALDALRELRPHDEVAVMAFGTNSRLLQGFTRDRRLAAEKIREASGADLGSGTFYEEALATAAAHMNEAINPASRRIILVVTDNVGVRGLGSAGKRAREEIAESGAVVYGLVVRAAIGKVFNVMTLGLLHPLDAFVEQTGGELVGADKKEVERRLALLVSHLRARYNLGYKPSNTNEDGRARTIRLQLTRAASEAAKRRGEKPHVRTRQSYYFRRRPASG